MCASEDREMPGSVQDHEMRERIADELARNDECGPGPVSRQEYLDDADVILSLIRTYGGTQEPISGPVDPAEHERVKAAREVRDGDVTDRDLIQLAQDRQIEINVWRGRLESAEAEIRRLRLSDRDLSALRFAVTVVRGIEETFENDPTIGTREGEATSDVLAAIISRAENT